MRIAEITKDEYRVLSDGNVVAVIPLGSIEQHGPHLPMGTDSHICQAIVDAAEAEEPALMLVTPVLWIGNSVNHLGYGAALVLDPTRYVSVLVDVATSFIEQGFDHILFVNAHGANIGPMVTAIHQLEFEHARRRQSVQIGGLSWWSLDPEALEDVRDSPDGAAGHACEIETSIMLSAQPTLVHTDRYVEGTESHPHSPWLNYDFNGRSYVTVAEMFHRFAPNGVAGLPALATVEKGDELVRRVGSRLASFVRDFSCW